MTVESLLKQAKKYINEPNLFYKYCSQASSIGSAEGDYLLGECYMHGLGVRKNRKLGMNYYYKAACNGYVGSCGILAVELIKNIRSKIEKINNGTSVIRNNKNCYAEMAGLIVKAGVVKEFLDAFKFFDYGYEHNDRVSKYYFDSVINRDDWAKVLELLNIKEAA